MQILSVLNSIDGVVVTCGEDTTLLPIFRAVKDPNLSALMIASIDKLEQSFICSALREMMVPSAAEGTKEASLEALCEAVSTKLCKRRCCKCVSAEADPSTCLKPRSAISNAFLSPFQGTATLAMLYGCILDVLKDVNKFYGPMVTVVQHSCSGKTRACMELGMTVCPLIYICYRDNNQDGYPNSAQSSLRAYLLFEADVSPLHPLKVYLRYTSFIVAAILSFRLFWQATAEDNGDDKAIRDHLKRFLNAQLDGSLRSDTERPSPFLEWLYTVARGIEDTLWQKQQTWSYNDWSSLEKCIEIWLEQELPCKYRIPNSRDFYGVIFFDEERIFGRRYTQGNITGNPDLEDEHQTLSVHMQRATRLLRSYRCVSIRSDTTSELDIFRPKPLAVKTIPSARGLIPGVHHCLYYLLLERNLGAADAPMNLGDGNVNHVSYMSRFGAPIWHCLIRAGDTTNILAEAERKLFGGIRIGDPSKDISMELSAACVGATAHLDVASWFTLSSDLVSSHMAQLEYLDRPRRLCLMGYPPDPILAAVATRELLRKEHFAKHMENLSLICHRQFASSGHVTELLSRLLCVMAAYCEPQTDASDVTMTVENFLQCLCPYQSPTLPPRATRLQANASMDATTVMLEGRMNLRQFVPLRNKKELSREALCLGAQRGVGFITANCQEGFDAIIPVVLRNPVAFNPTPAFSSDRSESFVAAEKKAAADTTNTQAGSKAKSDPAPSEPSSSEFSVQSQVTMAISTPQSPSVQRSDTKSHPTEDTANAFTGSMTETHAHGKMRATAHLELSDTERDTANETVSKGPPAWGSNMLQLLPPNPKTLLEDWNKSLLTREDNWSARNGEVTLSSIKAQVDDIQQRESNRRSSKSIVRTTVTDSEPSSSKPFDITPERVTYLALQFKFRSNYENFTGADPLRSFESEENFQKLDQIMPRMVLVMTFTPFRKVEDEQLPPKQRLPSALVDMTSVNPHHHWPADFSDPLERIFEKLCSASPSPPSGDTLYSSQHLPWLYDANLPMGL